jgi:hypothetical protein
VVGRAEARGLDLRALLDEAQRGRERRRRPAEVVDHEPDAGQRRQVARVGVDLQVPARELVEAAGEIEQAGRRGAAREVRPERTHPGGAQPQHLFI